MALTGRIPGPIGTLTAAGASLTDPKGNFDVLIGGIPFVMAPTQQSPFLRGPWRRATVDFQKSQTDTEAEPGEQSLSGDLWWYRSQSSFHGGAGREYAEPVDSGDTVSEVQYLDSLNVDVSIPGRVKLLPAVNTTTLGSVGTVGANPTACAGTQALDGSAIAIVTGAAAHMYVVGQNPSTGALTITDYAETNAVGACSSGGQFFFVRTSDHTIQKATNPASYNSAAVATAALYTDATNITSTGSILAWVKQRLMGAFGASVYALDANAAANPALPTALFTHPNASWQWTAFAETPNSIMVAGFCGDQSAVFRCAEATVSGVPTLEPGIVSLPMPTGERIYSMTFYLGQLVLGTNKGIRVCSVDASDNITLAPLTVDFSAIGLLGVGITDPKPVRALATSGDFVYGAFAANANGSPTRRIVRLDLGELTNPDNVFAWQNMYDLVPQMTAASIPTSNEILGLAVLADGVIAVPDGTGGPAGTLTVFSQSPTQFAASGTLTTGRIRYHTLEPKLFSRVLLRADSFSSGSLQAQIVGADGSQSTGTLWNGSTPGEDVALGLSVPQEWAYLVVTLTAGSGQLSTPVFRGYQMKALIVPPRQREEVMPLQCFDTEIDRSGTNVGRPGWSWDRLKRLEALDGTVVTLQHQSPLTFEVSSEPVLISSVEFNQESLPSRQNVRGGYIKLTVRTLS